MSPSHTRNATGLDPRRIEIHFSPEVRRALGDLEAAVHFSDHFDADVHAILQGWAASTRKSLHDVLIALPLVAEETFRHIRATGDERAQEAWRELCNQMPENGFALTRARRPER